MLGTTTNLTRTFDHNSTLGAGNGGAIACAGIFFAGSLTIRTSTIAFNTAASNGGGISDTIPIALTLQNSTVTGNVALGAKGGGISLDDVYLTGGPPPLTLESCIVSGNSNPTAPDISSAGSVMAGNNA